MKHDNTEAYLEKENYVLGKDLAYRKAHHYHRLIQEYHDVMQGGIERRPVLHIGCNDGSTSALLREYHDVVIGVDINREAIDKAIAAYTRPDLAFVTRNILELTDHANHGAAFSSDYYPGVYLFDIIEHIFPDDMHQALAEVEKVLMPGGHVLIFTPRLDPGDPGTHHIAYDSNGQHVQFFREEIDIVAPLEEHFDVVECVNDKVSNLDSSIAPGRHNAWRVLCKKR